MKARAPGDKGSLCFRDGSSLTRCRVNADGPRASQQLLGNVPFYLGQAV